MPFGELILEHRSTVMINQIGEGEIIVPDRDDKSGKYTSEYPDNAFLRAISDHDGMVGTGEIAEVVGCAHDTAYKRLQTMEDDGLVSSHDVGNTLVWTISEDN